MSWISPSKTLVTSSKVEVSPTTRCSAAARVPVRGKWRCRSSWRLESGSVSFDFEAEEGRLEEKRADFELFRAI